MIRVIGCRRRLHFYQITPILSEKIERKFMNAKWTNRAYLIWRGDKISHLFIRSIRVLNEIIEFKFWKLYVKDDWIIRCEACMRPMDATNHDVRKPLNITCSAANLIAPKYVLSVCSHLNAVCVSASSNRAWLYVFTYSRIELMACAEDVQYAVRPYHVPQTECIHQIFMLLYWRMSSKTGAESMFLFGALDHSAASARRHSRISCIP